MAHYYSETEVVASVKGLNIRRLRSFVAAECVIPAEQGGKLAFEEIDLARLRLAAEVCEDFDLDEDAAAVILSLIDQIHGLRGQLRALGEAISAEPEDIRSRIAGRIADAG